MLDPHTRLHRFLDTHPWIIFALCVLGFSISANALVRLDQVLDVEPNTDAPWLYGGGADAAIAVLTAIASSAVTVAGVIFSATFVTMQLASSQYTPRVIQTLSRRWYLHAVLGMFLGSFSYSLIVLRSIRPSSDGTPPEFVPVIAVSTSIMIALASVGVLIFYIIYGMRSLEPAFLINSAAAQTQNLLESNARASERARSLSNHSFEPPTDDQVMSIRAERAGYFQMIDFSALSDVTRESNTTVEVTAAIGQFLFPGEQLAIVWPANHIPPQTIRRIRETLRLGEERTAEQDVEYGFRRVADIMLKALSAAINDPTTAEYCMNTLGNLIVLMANEHEAQRHLLDPDNTLRIIWEPEPFARCVHTAFDQLRFYVHYDVQLATYALSTFRRIHALVPGSAQSVIEEITRDFIATVLASMLTDEDKRAVGRAASWLAAPATST